MITLATVSPCYNEEEVLEQSAAHLTALFDNLIAQGKISNESVIVFVNDGSRDRSAVFTNRMPVSVVSTLHITWDIRMLSWLE